MKFDEARSVIEAIDALGAALTDGHASWPQDLRAKYERAVRILKREAAGGNTYDSKDRVQREGTIMAGGLKVAAYRVRDVESGEYGPLQFHMTYDNTVLALMSEQAAKLFATFVNTQLAPKVPANAA